MLAVILAQIATLIPFLFGLATATIVAIKAPDYIAANNYVGGLLAVAPSWFFLPVCLIAVIGGMSTGTTSLYGTGLDMSSVFPRVLSRVKATLLIGVMSIAFIFIGRFAANLVQSVSTFAVLIITCTTPWMVIMIIGLMVRRGFYCPDDLQVFTRGEPAAATGSATAGTGAAWVPGSRARWSACASSTCRGSSSAAGQPGRRHRHQPAGDAGPGVGGVPDVAACSRNRRPCMGRPTPAACA
jgi:purine-cytosine permease-like protein